MNKPILCRICSKRFANGKAMGGHMRSHLAKLPIPPKPQPPPPPPPVPDTLPKSPSSSSSLTNPNHMQCYRSVNRELVCCLPKSSNLVIKDRESGTDSTRNLTRRRSKRRCRLVIEQQQEVVEPPPPPPEQPEVPESVSSVTETFPVEDVAMCLVMLSRDKWPTEEKEVVEVIEVEDSEGEEGKDDEEDEDVDSVVTRALTKSQSEYKCDTCNKVFGSYQALGGHRASHKNKKIKIEPEDEEEEEDDDDEEEEEEEEEEGEEGSDSGTGGDVGVGPIGVIKQRSLAHECPLCDKVFESGQALGGHRKAHYAYLPLPDKNPAGKSGKTLTIDLNLPAPEEEED